MTETAAQQNIQQQKLIAKLIGRQRGKSRPQIPKSEKKVWKHSDPQYGQKLAAAMARKYVARMAILAAQKEAIEASDWEEFDR